MAKSCNVIFINTLYKPPSGSFSYPRNYNNNRYEIGIWYNCRDIFNKKLFDLTLFFFSHDIGQDNHVIAFITKIENILDVQPRSKFGPTQRKSIMWIQPSKWWTWRVMRRSLFTILIRAVREYLPTKDNFEDVIASDKYLRDTKYAFYRFLEGNTHYTGKLRGWHKQFYKCVASNDEINKLLIKK